jgi:hypothetical protein
MLTKIYRVSQNKIENFLSKIIDPSLENFLFDFSDISVAVTIFVLTN